MGDGMMRGNKPAFPATETEHLGIDKGINVRQYFAAKAMEGLCAHAHNNKRDPTTFPEWCAQLSVKIADSLLRELEK